MIERTHDFDFDDCYHLSAHLFSYLLLFLLFWLNGGLALLFLDLDMLFAMDLYICIMSPLLQVV